ncbi:MAG: LysM peptidoglycan-binding domain-containing protein, partial [Anaerolineaceae bacterium]
MKMKNKISLFITIFLLVSLVTSPVYAQTTEDYPEYIVQPGDTLSYIATLFDVSMDEIQIINNLADPNSIYPDLRLKIPGYPGIKGLLTPVILGYGEIWQNLVVKYHTDENTLIKINKLISPKTLYPGSELLMPIDENLPILNPVAVVNESKTLLENTAILNAKPYILFNENRKNSSLDFYTNDLIYDNNPDLISVNSISDVIASISVSPLPLLQGDTLTIEITTRIPLNLSGNVDGKELIFFSNDNTNYFAFAGIHAMAPIGIINLTVSGSSDSETLFTNSQNLLL